MPRRPRAMPLPRRRRNDSDEAEPEHELNVQQTSFPLANLTRGRRRDLTAAGTAAQPEGETTHAL